MALVCVFSELMVSAYLEIGGGGKGKINKNVYTSKPFVRMKKLQYLNYIFYFSLLLGSKPVTSLLLWCLIFLTNKQKRYYYVYILK